MERASAIRAHRERPRLPFDGWLHEVSPDWCWHWLHLVKMREVLARVRSRELLRVIFMCPPRHGKTEQNTIRFPVHWLEDEPTLRVIIGGYNQEFATEIGSKARRLARTRFTISREADTKCHWETLQGGGIRCVGVGSGVTGKGADLILVDDPVKSREEAESQAYRNRVWDWYRNDLYTRAEPGCAIVITATPWHQDDLIHRILASGDAANWTVVRFPALAEPDDPLGRPEGAALCPERYTAAYLRNVRDNVLGPYGFAALYQCRPGPAEGNLFKQSGLRYWIREDGGWIRLGPPHDPFSYRVRVSDLTRFATVDLAFGKKKESDWTVMAAWGLDYKGNLILLDLERDRIDPGDLTARIAAFIDRNRCSYAGIEATQAQSLVVAGVRRCAIPVKALFPDTSKPVRHLAAAVRWGGGGFWLPAVHPARSAIEDELLNIPKCAHDDIADVFAYGHYEAYRLVRGEEPADEREARLAREAEALQAELARAQDEHLSIQNEDLWASQDPDDD